MNYVIKGAHVAQTTQNTFSTHNEVDLRICDGTINKIAETIYPQDNDEVIDAKNCAVLPGLINTHHHLAQSGLKGIPQGLNSDLGDWLVQVPYRFWPHITPDLMYCAATIGLAEQLRSGATTCADHHYLYHANISAELEDAVWQAAHDLGIRLVLCRGGATALGSHKGLAKAGIQPESIEQMLDRLDQSLTRYHQATDDALQRLVVAPTSLIHSSKPEHLKILAEFARSHQLKMHSHLLEVDYDETQAQNQYGKSAIDYAESCDWLGPDVWFAHLVKTDKKVIERLAQTQTSVAHCPTSNCRLGSGVAPIIAMQNAGINVSIGIDGSASSENASMIQELNLAWLLHRALHGSESTTLVNTLCWGSRNAAKILGLEATGQIAEGKCADLVIYELEDYRYWGNHSPTLSPILLGEPVKIKTSFVGGKPVVRDGEVLNFNKAKIRTTLSRELKHLFSRVS